MRNKKLLKENRRIEKNSNDIESGARQLASLIAQILVYTTMKQFPLSYRNKKTYKYKRRFITEPPLIFS
jgi:hypothetical protein